VDGDRWTPGTEPATSLASSSRKGVPCWRLELRKVWGKREGAKNYLYAALGISRRGETEEGEMPGKYATAMIRQREKP